ncbi:SAM-dependent methyltransferase [Cryptosporangium sp. NPDC048952]|uniref:SAM-dependent methyltransferase n=1 Tax=Cryptosporangium sp. NPDC048952 TaxID=3363961 RepID=UPI003724C0A1
MSNSAAGIPAGSGNGLQGIDTSVAHPARRYDYWLGGKDNFAADRHSADEVEKVFPTIRTTARQNRAFLRRVVTYLAREAGVRQFIDIGAGLPTAPNVHEVAQAINPAARIVFVDNDPIVLVHARALLQGTPEGATAYLAADVREPSRILGAPELHEVLDLREPVALLLIAILHFLEDADQPHDRVREYLAALAPGSYLAISHITTDFMDEATAEASRSLARTTAPAHFRTSDEVAGFLDGLDMIHPGVVSVADWRPEPDAETPPSPAAVSCYGALGRKPAGPGPAGSG